MRVKLGPISLSFLTDVSREEVDETARLVRLAAKAREERGRGAAERDDRVVLSSAEGGQGDDRHRPDPERRGGAVRARPRPGRHRAAPAELRRVPRAAASPAAASAEARVRVRTTATGLRARSAPARWTSLVRFGADKAKPREVPAGGRRRMARP